jgi:hypothetical protein
MAPQVRQGIVVLGMPRSGTTLLRRILDGHPKICAPGETFLLRATSRFFESEEIAFGIDYGVLGGLKPLGFSEEDILSRVRELAFSFYEELARSAGKSRWAAKTAVDSFYAGAIDRLYGGHVRFICVLRHGLDVACSIREFSDELQGFIGELRPYIQRYSRPLEAFAHAWADVTTALLELSNRRSDSALVLRYEDLVSDPEPQLMRMFQFIGEEWDPQVLRSAFSKKEVVGLGDWKTYSKGELKRDSIERWRQLPDDMVARLAPVVNPTLMACGYPAVETGQRTLSPDEAMRRYELAMMFKSTRPVEALPKE